MLVSLPPQIHAKALLSFLSMLSSVEEQKKIELDFGPLRRISPGGLIALTAITTRWLRQHREVTLLNLGQCSITGYLQRMDFLRACGAELPERFQRHDSAGRFVPVRALTHNVEDMGHELATCLAPGGEDYGHPNASLYDLAWYVFTEIANNARQHSAGIGYAAAQVTRGEGLVRIAVGDNGNGIRKSFLDAGLEWAGESTDCTAILRALKPRVSSKGHPTNEGVGLTLVSELVRQTRGWLLVVSGNGVVILRPGSEIPESQILPDNGHYPGTLVVAAFRQQDSNDFAQLLHDAKVRAGLLSSGKSGATFT